MHSILKEIFAEKEKEVQQLKTKSDLFLRQPDQSPRRDFGTAISRPGRINLIAEIKFASPSAGMIRETVDPEGIGRMYEQAGAAAISLLTDRKFFAGDIRFLPRVKNALHLPILRKDFIIDPVQVRESAFWGADAILLIARILTQSQLKHLIDLSREWGMAALVEVHNQEDLAKAIESGAEIIGINNRDLDTFEVKLQTTLDLIPHIPPGCIKVSESGIKDKEDIRLLGEKGVQAVLVGTTLMKSQDITEKVQELVKAGIKG